nr:MAG TPA: hypothetical protein [Caudoviricetes sp.]
MSIVYNTSYLVISKKTEKKALLSTSTEGSREQCSL